MADIEINRHRDRFVDIEMYKSTPLELTLKVVGGYYSLWRVRGIFFQLLDQK